MGGLVVGIYFEIPLERLVERSQSATTRADSTRAAAKHGHDATDYTRSYTARSFVPHYAQCISSACVLHGAAGMIKYLTTLRKARLEAPGAGGHKA